MKRSDRKIPLRPLCLRPGQDQDQRVPRPRPDQHHVQQVPALRTPTLWPKPVLAGYAGRLPHRLHRPRCVGWLCSRMVAHTEQERVTGPWMEDPCSAPPSPTCTLTLPLPLRVTFLHICHSGNGKREGGKEQWRHGKRSTWLTINCVATWRVRKTERERDQRSEEEGERE